MKILVVSLLRLGDVLLTLPMLAGLLRRYPHADIHYLVNQSSEPLTALLPNIQWHFFNRSQYQKGLGEYESPFFDSFHQLKQLVTDLNQENYNLLINLTHTRLSGWLSSALTAQEKLGLTIDRRGIGHFGSAWFRFLNEYAGEKKDKLFHLSDIFSYGAGGAPSEDIKLCESLESQAEANFFIDSQQPHQSIILLQPFTSDEKKNWPLSNWMNFIRILKKLRPKSQILILAAPFEESSLSPLVSQCEKESLTVTLAICSLPVAFSLIQRAHLLVTGDTSIKHLTMAANCKVLEISLGSSDFRQTGVYRSGNFIVASREVCAPCEHSSSCPYSHRRCVERVSPFLVAHLANNILAEDQCSIKKIADEYKEKVSIFQTKFMKSNYWWAKKIGSQQEDEILQNLLNRSNQKMILEKEHRKLLGEFGTEAHRLLFEFNESVNSLNSKCVKTSLKNLEREAIDVEEMARNLFHQLQKSKIKNIVHRDESICQLKSFLQAKANRSYIGYYSLEKLLSYLNSVESFYEKGIFQLSRLRKIHEFIFNIQMESQIYLKLVRGIQTEMGRGEYECQ